MQQRQLQQKSKHSRSNSVAARNCSGTRSGGTEKQPEQKREASVGGGIVRATSAMGTGAGSGEYGRGATATE